MLLGMQDKKNNAIDARTFAEIWQSLGTSSYEQLDLRDALITRLRVTRQTVNYWGNGRVAPAYEEVKKAIAEVVNKSLGIRTTSRTLFPSR